MRISIAIVVLAVGIAAVGCSNTTDSDVATQFLDQWVTDWNAGDEQAAFEAFLPDGVLVNTSGQEFVGPGVAVAWSQYVTLFSLERTGEPVDNENGSYSFNVEFDRSQGTLKRVMTITMDGDKLVSMVETKQE